MTEAQPPDFARDAWQVFTAKHSPDEARLAFQARYGKQPEHVGLDTRYRIVTLKVGPVPQPEDV